MISYPVQIEGVATRVLASGQGPRTILLIHGLGSRADRWLRNLDALAAAGWRVLAPDLPGHGFATKGPGFDYTGAGYCSFLDRLLMSEGAGETIVVGTSFGGLIASMFALRHPERVRALVMVGTLGLMPIGAERRQKTIDWLPRMDRDSIRARLRLSVADSSIIDDEWVEQDFRVNTSPGAAESFAALARYYADGIERDVTIEPLARLGGALPILLLWGSRDVSIAPEIGRAAHERLPGSRFVTVQDTAHLPYFEKPQATNGILLDFIERT